MKKFVFNGKITNNLEDGDACSLTGIINENKVIGFDGDEIVTSTNIILCKFLEDELYRRQVAVCRYVISDDKIEDANNLFMLYSEGIVTHKGSMKLEYSHRYSDYTGYLWTDEELSIGGHDILQEIQNNQGKYIHLEIEVV